MNWSSRLKHYQDRGLFPPRLSTILDNFYRNYLKAVKDSDISPETIDKTLVTLLDLAAAQIQEPFVFSGIHYKIRAPIDYYTYGLDLLRPLIDFKRSKILGLDQVARMEEQLKAGENVVLLSNHQIEPDPQVISLLLEKTHPRFAEEIFFVAGDRVTTDPLAAPFSMGRNLICIYSKKHIDHPPELKEAKLRHNRRTMQELTAMLAKGGCCVFVAPSGGRDRPNAQGIVEVAPFDPQSLEMFNLLAAKAGKATHFYPLALATYDLLPPPTSVEKEIGEERVLKRTPVHAAFCPEIALSSLSNPTSDKHQQREERAQAAWRIVNTAYTRLQEGTGR